MKLRFTYDKAEDIPEALKDYYEPKEGKFVLLTEESVVPKAKLDAMREDAIQKGKELGKFKAIADELESHGISHEEIIRLKEIEDDLKAQKLYKKGEIDQVIKDKTADLITRHDKMLKSEKDKVANLTNRLEVMLIDDAATREALEQGLIETAVDDLKARARRELVYFDGRARRRLSNGEPDMSSVDGDVVKEWVGEIKPKAVHLFKGNTGGGGQAGKQTRSTTSAIDEQNNPFKQGPTFNLTKASMIQRDDPQKAQRLKELAGV